ncbi:MAG: glucose-1-phosphate thymidylyltransferase [Marinilabiliales bacterium]|nr:MAG: glucose-1-phosphate thymidylyltransferase [Marinilabiliales bacterium]
MNIILFDDISRMHLLPLTYTRPVADIRCGILTIAEKWKKRTETETSFLTAGYLQKKFPVTICDQNLLINGSIIPDEEIINRTMTLQSGDALIQNGELLAFVADRNYLEQIKSFEEFLTPDISSFKFIELEAPLRKIKHPWDIFSENGRNIAEDWSLITNGRISQQISDTNRVIAPENIFIEEGAKLEMSIINASTGPVYIGKNAEIMENSVIRGPFALCDHSVVKMSAKIYGPTTVGPQSKVGGEINNSVFLGYSNKAHDGFLGNSVIGEWCNLGADTNNSNLKNTYEEVKLWSHYTERFEKTGLQFCGLIMGDHSKCGINTMFNTGTVVGVSANIFGSGFQRNFVPSFSWGGTLKMTTFQLNKAFKVAESVMKRREIEFDDTEKEILSCIFDMSKDQRHG